MITRRKHLYALLLLLGLFCLYSPCCYWLADRFSLSNISSSLTDNPAWEIPPPTDNERQRISTCLEQPFTYLGKGSQCYVFESADKEWVLKFFRHERYRFPTWVTFLSLPPFLKVIQEERILEKQRKQELLFESCMLAYQELREESGLLFLHLNKTPFFEKNVTIKDKLGRKFSIEIDQYAYLIQKKGALLYPSLEEWMERGEVERAKNALSDLVILLEKRYEKGIVDHDAVISKNAGFLDDKPIYFDIGQFGKDDTIKDAQISYEETKKITRKLRSWIAENYPDLVSQLDQEIEKMPHRTS